MHRGGVASQGSPRGRRAPVLAVPVAAAAAVLGTGVLMSAAHAAPPPKNGKVTLCHATPPASAKNGWVQITVSANAVTHAGHGQHADDIIPAFTYYEKRTAAQYPGKNLATVFFGSTGAQILANGCRLPARPTSEPPTSTEPASTQAAPSVTHSSTEASEPAPTSAAASEPEPSTAPASELEPSDEPSDTDAPSDEPSTDLGSYSLEATATVRAGGRGAAPAVAAHAGLAAGDTGDTGGSGSSAGTTAAIVGAAVAGLAGLGGLAYWRRRREAVEGLSDGPGTAG